MRRPSLTITQRGQQYTARINARDSAGNRVQRRFSGATAGQVEAQAYAWLSEMAAGRWSRPDETQLIEQVRHWYAGYHPPSEATRSKRAVDVALIARDRCASVPLSALTTADMQGFANRLREAGYAPGSIRNAFAVLEMALPKTLRPLLDDVALPAQVAREWVILSESQARRLIDQTRGERLHALWVLAVMLGLRQGELLALGWDAVDLERGELAVRRHLSKRGGRLVFVPGAKTASGRRQLVLPEPCIDALIDEQRTQQQRLQGEASTPPCNWVFDDGTGEPWLSPGALWFCWRKTTRRLGLPDMRPHDLRHTAASHMLYAGVPVAQVSRILGHANPGVTYRMYAHVIERMGAEAAAKIGKMYG